jgi:phosphoribosylanthranilate isomerase
VKAEHTTAVLIKICGITNVEDAKAAADLGADAIGFVFAPSPRQISPDKAREIIMALPQQVQTVGVFVDEDPERVTSTASICRLDLLQFHGKESADYCGRFGQRIIKAVRVESQNTKVLLMLFCWTLMCPVNREAPASPLTGIWRSRQKGLDESSWLVDSTRTMLLLLSPR